MSLKCIDLSYSNQQLVRWHAFQEHTDCDLPVAIGNV